ncbi:UNVERIFIED_CONTAM: Polypyrimidine tract-binding protein2 [Sesamum radiatum]|uniref:Polypyrimidine tract-binding protein2 n=1 Tax=Sesamum radiatum TaxID=300843 RepID=A0AAW2NDN2_SESRA
MSSVSSQPQFRYTQPPSKVLHLRNLPWECTEEELIELGKPFGKVVNTKCNVGANRNQAFIEFAELNQAIAMISYYASSSEPAQVRGKTVYLQYSNRQEIVNNKTTADVAGNVLLVTIEGNDARLVSIDVLHLVFSAFGFVHKITTFEKTAGFQGLHQSSPSCCSFSHRCKRSDVQTAVVAKEALEGHCIYDGGYCKLHISYSRHTDLSIKVNNDRSRDYTIPSTPALNSQPSLLGQQPYPVGGPGVHAYGGGGAQYAPPSDPHVPPPAGWNPAGPAPPQSMPMQMHNYPYGPPAGAPAMGPGPVPPHGQNGLPHSSPMRPYHHQ